MPGSGSTAFSALIQSSDPTTRNILVLSEMDALSAIAVHLADFSWTLQKIRSLLLASLRFITKDQLPDQMIILKMRFFDFVSIYLSLRFISFKTLPLFSRFSMISSQKTWK
ncbi:unnamed protein product [Anisakis simplex]|nr:unnamed protein product [Anisakis simplex]